MKDSRAVLEFLASVGLKRSGDLVELVPSESFTKEVERPARTMVVTISTRARDRAGDIIEPKGVRLERYLRNPVVLWAHDYAQRPVAKSLWVRMKGPSVIAKPRFHDSSDLAREVFSLYAEGYLNAWSIGFIPEDWEEEGKGFRITRWDLLEYSAVPVPANPEALTLALKEKRITSPLLCKALGAALPDLIAYQVTAPQVDAPHPALPPEVSPSLGPRGPSLDPEVSGSEGRDEGRGGSARGGGGLRTVAPSPPRGEGRAFARRSGGYGPRRRGEGNSAHPPEGGGMRDAPPFEEDVAAGARPPTERSTVPPDESEPGRAQARHEIELERNSGPEKTVEVTDLPGVSADLSRRIRDAVREEVRGEIRRLKGSLEPYRKEEGK